MRILVIDNSPIHQEAARQTLKDHDLTVVGTYDEAHKLLKEPRADYFAVKAELTRRGFKPYDSTATNEERAVIKAEMKLIEKELCPPPPFEAVLCDLLMPASRMTMGDKGMKFAGQEMPVGFALSLMAALQGAKYVAVVTDTNHHNHPASAMLDAFTSKCAHEHDRAGVPPRFTINSARVGYFHAPMTFVEGTVCLDCDGSGSKEVCHCGERNAGLPKADCETCKGTGRYCWACQNSGKRWGKDWEAVLANLTSPA